MNMATSSSPTCGGSGNSIPMAAVTSTLISTFQSNNSTNPQRKRRRLEDAFRNMSLQTPTAGTSPSPFLVSSIISTTNSASADRSEQRKSMEEEIETDDDLDNDYIHSTSSNSIKNNLALYNLLMSSSDGDKKAMADILKAHTGTRQNHRNNPVDDKIEELIRTSRIRAMVETLQQQKGGKKEKSKKRTNQIQDCMVTKDDFHLKNNSRGRTLNRNVMDKDLSATTSNSGHRIRSNSLPREMKYSADPSTTQKHTQKKMDVEMSPL